MRPLRLAAVAALALAAVHLETLLRLGGSARREQVQTLLEDARLSRRPAAGAEESRGASDHRPV